MYCTGCGKQNPAGAVFCAFCGEKIASDGNAASTGRLSDEAHSPFMRPDANAHVTPLSENPAQPGRRSRGTEESEREYETLESVVPERKPRPAPRTEPRHETHNDLRPEPIERKPAPKPEPAKRKFRPEPAEPAATKRRPMRPIREEVPDRKPPISSWKKPNWANVDTFIPKQRKRNPSDLFFEDIDLPDAVSYAAEVEDERELTKRIKSGLALGLLLIVLGILCWLFFLPGGHAFRAGIGMGATAQTYAQLGERYLSENSIKRAADAYYDALRLEPNNYDYALKVARTQELTGNREKALSAYAKCIALTPSAPEPYRAVAALYRQMGENEQAANALKVGFDNTGDIELFHEYEASKSATP